MANLDAGVWDLGGLDDVCPNCETKLRKRPGRKTKCRRCGGFIYVRTRPLDRKRVLLTEADAATIQRQWDLVGHALRLPPRTTSTDLDRQLDEHARDGLWGLFRNAKLHLTALAEAERRWTDALRYCLEVCYIDVNGPCNGGQVSFDPTVARVAPVLVQKLAYFADWFGLTRADLRAEFVAVATPLRSEVALPVSPEDGWERLELLLDEQACEVSD